MLISRMVRGYEVARCQGGGGWHANVTFLVTTAKQFTSEEHTAAGYGRWMWLAMYRARAKAAEIARELSAPRGDRAAQGWAGKHDMAKKKATKTEKLIPSDAIQPGETERPVTCIACGDEITDDNPGIKFVDVPGSGQCSYCHRAEFGTWPIGMIPPDWDGDEEEEERDHERD